MSLCGQFFPFAGRLLCLSVIFLRLCDCFFHSAVILFVSFLFVFLFFFLLLFFVALCLFFFLFFFLNSPYGNFVSLCDHCVSL